MDIEIERPKRQRISVSKLGEFYGRKGISLECPICKTTSWGVPMANSIGGNAIPWGTGDGHLFPSGLPVVVMVCKNCFFVKMHSVDQDHLSSILEDIPDGN